MQEVGYAMGGLGDLGIEITGRETDKDAGFSSGEIEFGPGSSTSLPQIEALWGQRKDGHVECIPNDIRLLGVADRQDKVLKTAKDKNEKVNECLRKAMRGDPPVEVLQTLRRHFAGESTNYPKMVAIRDNIGLIGNVYWLREAYDSCAQMKEFHKSHAAGRPSYLLAGEECGKCALKQRVPGMALDCCGKIGLEIVGSYDHFRTPPPKVTQRLAAMGFLSSPEKNIKTWADLQQALILKSTPQERVYSATPRKPLTPGQFLASTRELNRISMDQKEEREKQAQQLLFDRRIKPVLRVVQEMMIKTAEGEPLRETIERKYFADQSYKLAEPYVEAMLTDPRMRGKLLFYPQVYSSCKQASEFLRSNPIPYTMAKSECYDSCQHRIAGQCSLLHSNLITKGDRVFSNDIIGRIDDLLVTRRISDSEARQFKVMEKASSLSGLRAAYALCDQRTKKLRTAEVISKENTRPTMDTALAKIESKRNAVNWASNMIAKGQRMSAIRQTLKEAGTVKDIDALIGEVVYASKALSADALDDCMGQSYAFSPETILVRAPRCEQCTYNEKVACRKLKLSFATSLISAVDTAESAEFKTFFAQPEMVVEVDPMKKTALSQEVVIDRREMDVDSGKVPPEEKDPGFQTWFRP